MAIIDTHAHLYLEQFDEDIDDVITRAQQAGIIKIFLPNIDDSSIALMFNLRDRDPDFFYPMLGLHPCSVKEDYKKKLDTIYKAMSNEEIFGIGEIGLDYYWDKSFIDEQKDAFQIQIEWAKELSLPIIIHSRDSLHDSIQMVSQNKDESLNGVFHCFTGTSEQANEIGHLGFFMGIGGVVTFKNGGLDKVLPDIPLDNLVVETDAPYLSPVPFRGKRNESSYLSMIIQKIADIYDIETEKVERISTENAIRLFPKAL